MITGIIHLQKYIFRHCKSDLSCLNKEFCAEAFLFVCLMDRFPFFYRHFISSVVFKKMREGDFSTIKINHLCFSFIHSASGDQHKHTHARTKHFLRVIQWLQEAPAELTTLP